MRTFTTLAIICGLTACSGPLGGSFSSNPASNAAARPPITTMDTPSALPGDTPSALPGDTPSALPGAQLGCDLTFAVDRANCTIAVNVNVPPISNPSEPANLLSGLHPADLQGIYAAPGQSAGATVAIVDAYDDPAAEADLGIYRAAFGLPSCTSANGCFRKVNESGAASPLPAPNSGWIEEISLDLDMVSAVCPNCKIVLVESTSPSFDDLGAGVNTAASLGAKAISNSYYGPEWSGETAYDSYYRHPGIAITVASGDQRSPFYPAASPYVTSVGGTTVTSGSNGWNQSVWAYDGAGCSQYESKPSWQPNTGCKTRSTVDMAAVADPQSGVTMYDSAAGGWLVAGGTSAAAPVVAALYALSGNGETPSYSYSHHSGFTPLGTGWYYWTAGLGSPHGLSGL